MTPLPIHMAAARIPRRPTLCSPVPRLRFFVQVSNCIVFRSTTKARDWSFERQLSGRTPVPDTGPQPSPHVDRTVALARLEILGSAARAPRSSP